MAAEQFGNLEQALQDLRDGKLILVIDDPERENEGDLICAAEHATPENINVMASLAKGLICMPMSTAICEQLVGVDLSLHHEGSGDQMQATGAGDKHLY